MKHVRRVALCLTGGLVVSVAVAWASAMMAGWPGQGRHAAPAYDDTPARLEDVFESAGRAQVWSGVGLTRRRWIVEPRPRRLVNLALSELDVYRAGWPLGALEWTDVVGMGNRSTVDPARVQLRGDSAWTDAWEYGVGVGMGQWRRLPIRVTSGGVGLAVNTLVWAGVLAGVGAGARAARRRRRRRRGLCVACGYPVRGADGVSLARCPECGVDASGAEGSP